MAQYFSSIRRWITPLSTATLFLGPASYWGFATNDVGTILAACITTAMLVGVYFFVIFRMRHPVISVEGNKIRVRGFFSGVRSIEDVRQYKLVLNSDFIAFRKDN